VSSTKDCSSNNSDDMWAIDVFVWELIILGGIIMDLVLWGNINATNIFAISSDKAWNNNTLPALCYTKHLLHKNMLEASYRQFECFFLIIILQSHKLKLSFFYFWDEIFEDYLPV
jgi:hypothetical protein